MMNYNNLNINPFPLLGGNPLPPNRGKGLLNTKVVSMEFWMIIFPLNRFHWDPRRLKPQSSTRPGKRTREALENGNL